MKSNSSQSDSFWGHVDALRLTIIRVLLSVAAAAVLCFAFYPSLIHILSLPLSTLDLSTARQTGKLSESPIRWEFVDNTSQETLTYYPPANAVSKAPVLLEPGANTTIALLDTEPQLVLFGPTDGFVAALRLSLWAGAALSSPLWLWLILHFVAPGLQRSERRLITPFLALSLLFFAMGLLFAFYGSIPIANAFLFSFNSAIGRNLWGLTNYLQFTSLLLLAHGIAFEAIVVLLFLVHLGRVSAEGLARNRRGVIVGIFVLAAILTPPDVITQCLLAAPLLVLYEFVVIYARLKERARNSKLAPQ